MSRAAPASQPMVPSTVHAESGLFTCKGIPHAIPSGLGEGEGEQLGNRIKVRGLLLFSCLC